MSASIRNISACRLCNGSRLHHVIDFGAVPLGNNLQPNPQLGRDAAAYPLELRRCDECSHYQLGHAVDPQILYATNYTYLSGVGASFVRHFEDYADWIASRCSLRPGALVVDVGSNDGTCLKAFKKRGFRTCGVDPAKLPAEIARRDGIATINSFFDAGTVERITEQYGRADLVTSHNVLAHVDDLAVVFRHVKAILKEGGYFAFEVGYFRDVLVKGNFDTIYHEHLDYHHVAPLVRHLTSLGLSAVEVSVNEIQGGSIRLLLQNNDRGVISSQVRQFLRDEQDSILYDAAALKSWPAAIKAKMDALHDLICVRRASGCKIVGYGAPTKIVLLLKTAGIDASHVECVLEDNVHKVGMFLPGSGIPIRGRDKLAVEKPDVLVLFAWNFAADILAKLLEDGITGLEVVVPLPKLESRKL